ncbi:TPA: preprotein translocase subunit Sec61beta [Candidatus Woesearchaeota archaeon]|nr:preprotein translocase subunit Sec61beta [Candidatus Woesearchaeota archaeon]
MADNQIRMPSGQGGLIRYSEEEKSRLEFSPGMVLILCILLIVFIILLHLFGGRFFA